MGVGAILEHPQPVSAVFARVDVVVFETVHLTIPLGAASSHGTDVRTVALLGFSNGKARIHGVVDGKIALPFYLVIL